MRGVNVSHLDAGALTGQTTRAKGRQATLVGETRERVVLVHELRQLGGTEELLDRGDDGAHVDQGLRGDRFDVLRGHALANDALHAGETGAHLVLDELADRADATVTEVVDVVNIETEVDRLAIADAGQRLLLVVQGDQVLDRREDVLLAEHRICQLRVDAELAVDLVTTDLREVVTLGVEIEVVEERASGLGGNLLSRTELAVNVLERLILCQDVVFLERQLDRREALELLENFFARQAEGLEEHGDRLLALAVDSHANLVALVDLELEPRPAARNDASGVDVLVGGLLLLALEVHAGRTHQLGHDDALRAVDDECALGGHQGKVAHENGLGLDLTREVIHELGLDVERRGEGLALFLALVNRVLLLFEEGIRERELHCLAEVFDGRDLFEDFLESGECRKVLAAGGFGLGCALLPQVVADEPVEALRLECEKIGNCQGVGDLRERKTLS